MNGSASRPEFGNDEGHALSHQARDERDVSRRYEVSLRDDAWRWWRNAPGFSQRFTATISADRRHVHQRHGCRFPEPVDEWSGDAQLAEQLSCRDWVELLHIVLAESHREPHG